MPPVLDAEQIGNYAVGDVQKRMKDWLDIVEKKYQVKPIIYTNIDFYRTYMADRFSEYPLWIAHYLQKEKPRIERDWIFWQHNDAGHVNGINSAVDFNVFNGDSTSFNKILLQ